MIVLQRAHVLLLSFRLGLVVGSVFSGLFCASDGAREAVGFLVGGVEVRACLAPGGILRDCIVNELLKTSAVVWITAALRLAYEVLR
jgi:hypothetical protein